MLGDVITVADPDLPKLHRKSNFFRQIGSQLRTKSEKNKNKGVQITWNHPQKYLQLFSRSFCEKYQCVHTVDQYFSAQTDMQYSLPTY